MLREEFFVELLKEIGLVSLTTVLSIVVLFLLTR